MSTNQPTSVETESRLASWHPRFTDALRSTVSMNGGGIAGVLALLQVMPKSLGLLSLCASPFVAGLFVGILSWIFTFSHPQDPAQTKDHNARKLLGAVQLATGLFLVGLLVTLAASIYHGFSN